ncbi:Protein CBR-NFI-1 [Caenorhabditis briggsae]|uniref:Protein CBR-NFI-1 n=1 Tax=Caenorhabditis briggsae TaxID=6238 RepID=A8XGU4_CAEBR|nr:Protein CBR-NFI-1 [Caenorhabditis briggsae]CAP31868.1 Protein CBR-NFI-1 [Caenorhabditis briggsae]
MRKHMDPHLKVDVNASSGSSANAASTSDAEVSTPPQPTMPPPSNNWNRINSPDAVSPRPNEVKCYSPYPQEDGPFVEQCLPYVRASAYNWFHLQAAKRKHPKDHEKRMNADEENKKLAELQNDSDDAKVVWASRLLNKLRKDIRADYKDAFISVVSGIEPDKCVLTVPDQRGKMRRIDILRQSDKVWRLDLVTIILFKGIPLESTDGERLERVETCSNPLCINPFHLSISVRGLDIFMATYLKDVNTKITYNAIPPDIHAMIKQEPGEPLTSAAHMWGPNADSSDPIVLSYDPIKACHTYFGGRATLQQPNSYANLENKNAIDNNYFDPKRSVLCLPPPPPLITTELPTDELPTDNQPLEICEDSNDVPSKNSDDSPNSSTNQEVTSINSNQEYKERLMLGQNSSIWQPQGNYNLGGNRTNRQENQIADYQSQEPINHVYRTTKPVRRIRVNAGTHGDVGVLVVDERNHPDPQTHAQNIVNALTSICTTPTQSGRKRTHTGVQSPYEFLNRSSDLLDSILDGNGTGSDVSPPHAAVSNLISRESNGFMGSPTKFTTARGDTTSFSKILQKIEEKHGQQLLQNQPSTSGAPPVKMTSSPVEAGSVRLVAPIALKPTMMSMSGCNSIVVSPITTPRITPFRGLEDDSLINALGLANSNDGSLHENFLQHFIESNSRSPLLNGPSSFSALAMGNMGRVGNPQHVRPESSTSNGSNSLRTAMGLIAPPTISLTVSQPTTIPALHQLRMGVVVPSACSPSSSNSSLEEEAANQAPISNAPIDPNAPKLPTDFSQALRDEKK